MIHYHKCPLCSSENISIHLKTADYFLSKEEFSLFKCNECGFIFTQDHPDNAGIGRYYDSDEYLSHSETKSGLFSSIYRLSRRMMLGRKVKIVSKLSGLKKGSILDIGSGTGHFLNVLQKAGWNVRGVEINDKARQYSISEFGLEILDPVKLQAFEPGSFDCITLWHVLEHFQDPFSYAQEILRLLKPGGSCIIALPNSGSYDVEYYSIFWAAYDVPRHLWHFTPETFKIFAKKSGFEVKEISPLPLDVFYISVLSEKYKGATVPFVSGMVKGLWFSLLSLFNKQRSSSLIYSICKSDT
jgi:2-polyprenyl-3-methyl-5-hydroxy-6-metoxy-1,4-benzoquinol methylase